MTLTPHPKSDPKQDPRSELKDELDELPPIDGESEDSSGAEGDETIADIDTEESVENSLDDSTGENESPDTRDLALDHDEKSWVDEATETPDLDLGDMSLFALAIQREGERESAVAPDDADDRAAPDDETGLADLTPLGGFDSGDEGPIDEDEELRDEDLPALDADDEGEPEDAGFVDERFAASDPLGLPWAAAPWSRVGAPLGVFGATAIACAGHGAVVAGRVERDDGADGAAAGADESRGSDPRDGESADEGDNQRSQLLFVDLEGEQRSLAAAGLEGIQVASLAAYGGVEPELLAVVAKGGRTALSRDGGRSFEMQDSLRPAAEVAIAAGVVWVRTRDGAVWRLDADRPPSLGTPSGTAAITTHGANLAGLVLQEDRRPTATLVTRAESLAREPIVAREARDVPESRTPALFDARGRCIAYAGRTGVVRQGPDGSWKRFAWSGRVTALAFVDDDGTLLAAVYVDADDSTGLVRVDPAGNATIVGRLGAPRSRNRFDGRVLGMACDDARGVVWVAGGFGVAAFAITR